MKQLFIGIFVLANIICVAQAKLGMTSFYQFSPNDTVNVNTTVTLTTVVQNKGNAPFIGTFTIQAVLDTASGAVVPVGSNTYTVALNPNDTSITTVTFTPNPTSGWKVSGNGNTIVVWPVSSSSQTLDSIRTVLVVNSPSSILEYDKLDVHIYPNPSNGKLFIIQPTGVVFKQIVIYDMLSQEVKISSYSEALDLKDLNAGVYWIVLSNDKKTYRQKFIKE